MIKPGKVVDLTHNLDHRTIRWPTDPGFAYSYDDYGRAPEGYFYAAGHFSSPDHAGTHMDAPLHFNGEGLHAGQVPVASLVGPAAVIDFSTRALADPDAVLLPADIARYERIHGPIPAGAIVVAHSGWGRFWGDPRRYLGTQTPEDASGLHFPGFSFDAARLLLELREVIAIAIDTASLDPGNHAGYPVHRLWLGANRPGFENLADVDKLPASGALLVCAPMKIYGATGAPARIFAVLP